MDSPKPPQPFSQSKRLRTGTIFVAVALLAVVIIGIAKSSQKAIPEPPLVWLDQSQFARQMQPGRLKRLYYKVYYKVVSLTAPVWQRFRRPKRHVQIAAKILAVQGVTTGQLGIGAAIATNDSGTQVWILSAAELNDLRQRLPTNRFEVVWSPTITTEDGFGGGINSGQVLPQTSAWVGVNMVVSTKITSHELQLTIYTFYTKPNDSPTIPIRTNLSAAFRAKLSNAGGMLISSPVSRDLNGTNYWLILESTAVDGYDKPIKL
jgi:hypothetical protein